MKILAPVCSSREVLSLISAGAGELYCGIHPGSWRKNSHQDLWVNRRGPGAANIGSFAELGEITGIAHSHKVPVFLTLNLPFYPPGQYSEIISLVKEATGNYGIDALIIGDPGLIMAIRETSPSVPVHVSSLAAVLNSASVSFFHTLGASRIIFPRYIGLGELANIISKAGVPIEYEVFMLNDGCVFEEGYCNVSHAFGGAFCHLPWSYSPVETSPPGDYPRTEPFNKHLRDYHYWLACVKNFNGQPGPGGYPLGMCGLCAIPELKAMGVTSLKIVGREAPTGKKTASVRLVKRVLDQIGADCKAEAAKRIAQKIRSTPQLCASGYMCYFK
ncbi:MAG: peptidase U32 family protein [Desulfocucumaceae bacterium]